MLLRFESPVSNHYDFSHHGQAFSNDSRLFSHVIELLNIQPMLLVNYIATATNMDLLAPHQAILEELGVTSSEWNPLISSAPGSAIGDADLVLCNHAWGPLRIDPGLLLTNLASGAKQGGFILLHTMLKGETLGETIAFLSSTDQNNIQQELLTQVSGDSIHLTLVRLLYESYTPLCIYMKCEKGVMVFLILSNNMAFQNKRNVIM